MSRAGLLLIGHGSRREDANDVLRAVASQVAVRLPSYVVQPCFLEIGAPTIGEGYDALVAAGVVEVVAVPYFLYPGNHTSRDIPDALAVAAARHPSTSARLTASLDLDDRLVDIVIDRVDASPA